MANTETIGKERVGIVIADDHPLMRSGLAQQIAAHSDSLEVLGEADNGYKAIKMCFEKKPGILVLDLYMPGDIDGFDVLKLLRRKKMPIKVLVLTFDKASEVTIVRDYKADKCLIKDASIPTIIASLENLASSLSKGTYDIQVFPHLDRENAGENYQSDAQAKFSEQVQSLSKPLSPRETEILRLSANGLPKEAIAKKLVMSAGTVGVHLTAIYNKLGVHSKAEAVAFAFRNKLIED